MRFKMDSFNFKIKLFKKITKMIFLQEKSGERIENKNIPLAN